MTVSAENVTSGFALMSTLGVTVWLIIKHIRVSRMLHVLMSRIPLALLDVMIRVPTTEDRLLTTARGAKQFSCHFFVRKERFNEQLDDALRRYQQASAYSVKSRVSFVALVLWLLTFVLLAVYFLGSITAMPPNPRGTAAASTSTVVTASTVSAPSPSAQPVIANVMAAKSDGKIAQLYLILVTVALASLLFLFCLVICYHFGIYKMLVEDVITLCESAGLVAMKGDAKGAIKIDKVIEAKDDPHFKMLLRLIR